MILVLDFMRMWRRGTTFWDLGIVDGQYAVIMDVKVMGFVDMDFIHLAQ